MSEFELIIKKLEIVRDTEENGCYICDKEHSKILLDGINKQKEILDKIKEKLNVLNEEPYNATTYIMVITEIYKLLEEIE